jgi:uncharacterized protein YndB with AHSA1/START domain
MPVYTVVSQIAIPAQIDVCWRHLTEPTLIARWFADVRGSIQPGVKCEFHFGDGDFFAAQTREIEPPVRFRFTWRFMDAGGISEIEYVLLDSEEGTDVSVIDRGSYGREGAFELREGWNDFMARLKKTITTGENARYRWSETIGAGAIVVAAPAEAIERLGNIGFWTKHFPETTVVAEKTEQLLTLTFLSPAWGNQSTIAQVRATDRGQFTGISVSHAGWGGLPAAIRFQERKGAAGHWAAALREIESLLGHVSDNRYVAASQ